MTLPSSPSPAPTSSPVLAVVTPRTSDLGEGFTVRRALPSAAHRTVGPFVFFDEMGPHAFAPGEGLDVRPHPHIGLSTVTYLFEGEILHRDSLGTVASILPGEVNWMTAGRGIVHSERTPPAARAQGGRVWGLQLWVALPQNREDDAPSFIHYDAAALPTIEQDGHRITVIAGTVFGATSPVRTASPLFYADVRLAPDRPLALDAAYAERALYGVQGEIEVEGEPAPHQSGRLLVLQADAPVVLRAGGAGARLVILGGAPLDGPRFVWWNFVASTRERIERAKEAWKQQAFGKVPGETEWIPLPPGAERPPAPVSYP